jgi:hypothetical protein
MSMDAPSTTQPARTAATAGRARLRRGSLAVLVHKAALRAAARASRPRSAFSIKRGSIVHYRRERLQRSARPRGAGRPPCRAWSA